MNDRVDFLTPAQRSERMSRIRAKGTKPELVVRRLAHRLGYRFRLHRRDLPGTPDLVFPARRKVVMVHGCFWHAHGCRSRQRDRAMPEYWVDKLRGNVERDKRNLQALKELGWSTLTLWECQLRDLEAIERTLKAFLGKAGSQLKPALAVGSIQEPPTARQHVCKSLDQQSECIYDLHMISWDEPKRRLNLRKHGIDLAELESAFDSPMVTVEDDREAYGELRLQSLAMWRGRVIFLVWTERDDSAHLISCRYADRSQIEDYFAGL